MSEEVTKQEQYKLLLDKIISAEEARTGSLPQNIKKAILKDALLREELLEKVHSMALNKVDRTQVNLERILLQASKNKVAADLFSKCVGSMTEISSDTDSKIYNPPGFLFTTLGKLLLPKKTYSRIIEPLILDMQEEYFEYLHKGETKLALWVKIRFIFIFVGALGLSLPLIKQLLDVTQKLAK